jgi:hypothetical protein
MIEALLELLDCLASVGMAATAGWRYLLSAPYRRQVHAEWQYERWYYIAWDVVCGTAGVLLSVLMLLGGLWIATRIFPS